MAATSSTTPPFLNPFTHSLSSHRDYANQSYTLRQANLQNMNGWTKEAVKDYIYRVSLEDSGKLSLTCLNGVNFSEWDPDEVMSFLTYLRKNLPNPLESIKTINFASLRPDLVITFFDLFKEILPEQKLDRLIPLPNVTTINFSSFNLDQKVEFLIKGKRTYLRSFTHLDWDTKLFVSLCKNNEEGILICALKDFQIREINLNELSREHILRLINELDRSQVSNLTETTIKENISKIDSSLFPKLISAGFDSNIFHRFASLSSSEEPKEKLESKTESVKFPQNQVEKFVQIKRDFEGKKWTFLHREDLFDGLNGMQNQLLFNIIPLEKRGDLSLRGIQKNIKKIAFEIILELPQSILHHLDLNSFEKNYFESLNASKFSEDQIKALNFSGYTSDIFYKFFKAEDHAPLPILKQLSPEKMTLVSKWMPTEWFSLSYLTVDQIRAIDFTKLGDKRSRIDKSIASLMANYFVSTSSTNSPSSTTSSSSSSGNVGSSAHQESSRSYGSIPPVGVFKKVETPMPTKPEIFTGVQFRDMTFDSLLSKIQMPGVKLGELLLDSFDEAQITAIFKAVSTKVIEIRMETIRKNLEKINQKVIIKLNNSQIQQIDINSFSVPQLMKLRVQRFDETQIRSLDLAKFSEENFREFFKDKIPFFADSKIKLITPEMIAKHHFIIPDDWFTSLDHRFQFTKINSEILEAFSPRKREVYKDFIKPIPEKSRYESSSSSSSSSSNGTTSSFLPREYAVSLNEAQKAAKQAHLKTGSGAEYYNKIRSLIVTMGNNFDSQTFYKIWFEISTQGRESFNNSTFFNVSNAKKIKEYSKEIAVAIHPDQNMDDRLFATATFQAFDIARKHFKKVYCSKS